MKLIPDWIYWLAIGTLVLAGGVTQIQLADERLDHAVTKQQFAEHQTLAFDMAVKKADQQKTALATLDEKHTKELTNAKLEISRLADSVRTGERRLRIAAACPASAVSEAPRAASVADDAGPRLTDAAERNYFHLRAGIETATSQIAGLQDYVLNVCLR